MPTKEQTELMELSRLNAQHINVLNGEMGELRDAQNQTNCDVTQIKTDLAKVDTNVEWLMRFFWVIATASIGSLVASLMQIIK